MRSKGAEALVITPMPEFGDTERLAALAIAAGLPTVCGSRRAAQQGCLIGYGPDFTELRRQAADDIARIFRGSSPSELPIEGPTHFDFDINLKTAKALGLMISPLILARADEVIERLLTTHRCRSLAEFNITLPRCRLTQAVPDPKYPRRAR
jgi:putative tryptophan/tyrosine transport system substrate-binding protein